MRRFGPGAQWMLLVGAIGAVSGGAHLNARREAGPRVTVGDRAPAFPRLVATAAGGVAHPVPLDQGPRLLVIWASWCGACRQELPSLEKLHRELGPRGLSLVAVSVDKASDAAAVRGLVKSAGLTFDIALDPEGKVARAYGVGPVPQAFVIGRDGSIRERLVGSHDWTNPAMVASLTGLIER